MGPDGPVIDVHHDPSMALSDGPQSITRDNVGVAHGQIAPVIGQTLWCSLVKGRRSVRVGDAQGLRHADATSLRDSLTGRLAE